MNMAMASIFQLLVFSSSIVLLTLGPKLAAASSIGVCYEIAGKDLPSPGEVVAMYRTHHIARMRLYEPNYSVLEALRGSGIQVLIGVSDRDIQALATSYAAANEWVHRNIRPYWPDVDVRYIAVGNEVIPGYYAQFVLPAMKNLHNALGAGGLWHKIKVSTPVSTSIMGVSYPPSAGTFSPDTIEYMAPIACYLESIGAPLLANVFPYFTYTSNPSLISLPYALFTSPFDVFTDYGMRYRNLFDATVDALHASLEKVGAPRVQVAVSETGWPSAGNNSAATTSLAWLYNTNLIQHVLSSEGTPRRPGKSIETYLFAMFNEGKVLGMKSANQFGMFYPDMTPVYPIVF